MGNMSNNGMIAGNHTSLIWAISEELNCWKERSAVNIFSHAFLWESNLTRKGKAPVRMDQDYIKTSKRPHPVVLRNRIKNAFRVYKHLMGMCQTNGGSHVIKYGNWRKHVKVRVAKHGIGTHDTMFAQTVIKVETKVGSRNNWQWQEVEA